MSMENLYRTMIMEHSKYPKNKGLVSDDAYRTYHLKNPSCGDDITIQVHCIEDRIVDVRHEGKGCAICCSSASMMSEVIKGQTRSAAVDIAKEFYELVTGTIEESPVLQDANALAGVSKFPARVKCATIAWKAMEHALEEETNE